MSENARVVTVPAGVILIAALVLLVLLARAQTPLTPRPTLQHLALAPAVHASAAQQSSGTAPTTVQALTVVGTTAPIGGPQPATKQPASQDAPAQGTCPTDAGSGLPCRAP